MREELPRLFSSPIAYTSPEDGLDREKRELFVPNKLRERVVQWRDGGYQCGYPALAEILEFNLLTSESGEKSLRFLRKAQFEALETYWYLRFVEKTPHVFELYKRLYDDPVKLFQALGINLSPEDLIRLLSSGGPDAVFDKIRTDDQFAKEHRLATVRETLNLSYPSYILALAMGAGKTVLIGAIIATEFCLALDSPEGFVKNALVFAPGKTILGALKDLSDIPYERILPPRLYKQFMSSVKITYTKDDEKDIPIIRGSSFNIIVTNTEKIRIQKPTRKAANLTLLDFKNKEKVEEQQEIANLRLQTIASLSNLAIFSDEAHHTYGQALDTELKKVRRTVDYLADNTNVIVVVNTTGTPYYKKQMLRDVVFWYGLSQGIKDGILKEVNGSIVAFEDVNQEQFVSQVLEDFVGEYGSTTTYDGAKSKLAIYFPQTDDLKEAKPHIERRAKEIGLDPSTVLEVTNKSPDSIKDLFNNRINEPHNPYRIYLLVNMGTEGWNCPSLFSTALARKLKSSNNFVLQAASRCLRQTAGNTKKARIYLSKDNVNILDSQLKETFGETLQVLDTTKQEMRREKIVLRTIEIPPILVKKKVRRVVVTPSDVRGITIQRPQDEEADAKRVVYDVKEGSGRKVLTEKEAKVISLSDEPEDIYDVASELSSNYRLEMQAMYEMLRATYPSGDIPRSHVVRLQEQVEAQTKNYKITEETVEVALALIKLDGFEREEKDGNTVYTAEIAYHKDKEHLLLRYEELGQSKGKELSFHYSPYNLDSNPEKDFLTGLLAALDENPDDVDEVYYTGAITEPNKTDFLFEYKDKNGKWRNYTPDFVIRKKDGKVLIVEVKGEVFRDKTKEMAITELENLNPDRLKYEILVTKTEEVGFDNRKRVENWIYRESS